MTEKIENSSQINLDNVDAVITGSDQVWNSNLTGGLDDVYTINFGSNKLKRISYAASLGKNKIEENLQKEYKDKLSRIDKISVREESAKEALNKLLPNKEIEVVLDPTLLLTKDEWNKKINKNNSEKEKYILSYIVENNPEHTRIVDELSKNTGLKVIHFEKKKKYNRVLRSAYIDGPIEFINLIKNAEYVVTTSFHATVFSIIFNKKFWVVPHKTTGSRVTDLLDKFEISNRAIQSLEAFNKKKYDEEIDYKKVNKILEKEREKTIRWLTNAIEK